MATNEYRPQVLDIQKLFVERNTRGERTVALVDSGLPSQSYRSHESILSAISTTSAALEKEIESVYIREKIDEEPTEKEKDEGISISSIVNQEKAESIESDEEDEGSNIAEAFPEQTEPIRDDIGVDESECTPGQCLAHHFAMSEDARHLLAPYSLFIMAKDDEGDTALHTAIIHNNAAVVLELMQSLFFYLPYCIDTQNKLGQTPLHLAVALKQTHVVRLLVNAGARLDIQDRKGDTPLHIACRRGDVRSLAEMLKPTPDSECAFEISDLSQRNYDGFAPMHLAVLSQSDNCVRCLSIAGADVDIEDGKSGRRPLHHAVELDNLLLMTTLIYDCNADVDAVNFDGSAPLHFAAGRGLSAATALLVASGADTAVWNYEGDSPYDISIGQDISEMCRPTRERDETMEGVSDLDVCPGSL